MRRRTWGKEEEEDLRVTDSQINWLPALPMPTSRLKQFQPQQQCMLLLQKQARPGSSIIIITIQYNNNNTVMILIIIIKGHSLRRACLQPATNTQNSKPRPPTTNAKEN